MGKFAVVAMANRVELPEIRRPRLEHHESRDFARWLRRRQNITFAHVPNEGKRTRAMAQRAKAEGMSRGVPDFLIFTPPPKRIRCPGVAIEMKQKTGGRVSLDQEKWLADLQALGWETYVAEGVKQAITFMQSLGY